MNCLWCNKPMRKKDNGLLRCDDDFCSVLAYDRKYRILLSGNGAMVMGSWRRIWIPDGFVVCGPKEKS